jgi:DNA modification methylase
MTLAEVLDQQIVTGDSLNTVAALPPGSVNLFFTSPPYADQRSYSRIRPESYVEWFTPFAAAMFNATAETGSMVINIKERVVNGERSTYVMELVLAMRRLGWRWVEEYIWNKTNAIPGKFGPRTKDAYERVFHFARGKRPHFDIAPVRVDYVQRYGTPRHGRCEYGTGSGFGVDEAAIYAGNGADPGNVIRCGTESRAGFHSAPMPLKLAEFFVQTMCPPGGVVIDPFAGSGTTVIAALRHGRRAAGIEMHEQYAQAAKLRIQQQTAQTALHLGTV